MKCRVFIVDDDTSMRVLHRRLIDMEEDMTICGEAEDAETAIHAIEQLDPPPTVVLVDYSLQETSGFELIQQFRDDGAQFACVILSGYPESRFGREARRLGASAYVEKGNADRLLAVLREIVGAAGS